MKKICILLITASLFSFTTAGDITYSKKDKKFAISYLKETRDRLEKDIKGLSDAQLNWKASDSTWSIANCIEHIALSEKNLFDAAMPSLKEAANPARRSEMKYTDEQLIKIVTDRSFKAKAPEGFRPSGQFGDAHGALNAFLERRQNTINFFKTNKDDLRNHFIANPFLGTIDTYQGLIFMTGHTLRHTLQVEEIMANPSFPK